MTNDAEPTEHMIATALEMVDDGVYRSDELIPALKVLAKAYRASQAKLHATEDRLMSEIGRRREAEEKLLKEQISRVNEYARADGLIQWINNPKRSQAN